jgi:hypothetical protein
MGEDGRMKIYKVMIDVLRSINPILKDQKNQMQNFNFRGIDQVYNEVNQHFGSCGVFTIPNVLELTQKERVNAKGTIMNLVTVKMEYTFCADDGSNVKSVVYGEAADSGDKAISKAMSIAHKYAILQIFAIPTKEEKDPDMRAPLSDKNQLILMTTNPQDEIIKQIIELLAKKTTGLSKEEKIIYLQKTCRVTSINQLKDLTLEELDLRAELLRGE